MSSRIIYALNYLALSREGSPSGAIPIHGLQTLSLNTTFNLQNFFELGQLDEYALVEDVPNVEVSVEKLIDGYPLIYHLASQSATDKSLINRTNQKSSAVLSIFSDAQANSSGLPKVQALCSGLYINSLNYSLPVQGNSTESVTLVGNDKIWISSSFYFNGQFSGNDSPASGVSRRQNVVMGAAPTGSIWPTGLPGMTTNNGSGYNLLTAGQFGSHVQDVTISTSLNREDLYELGRRRPYFRPAAFPTVVTCTINMTPADFGDQVNANADTTNVNNEPIMIKLDDGTVFDLGAKNKLQSINFQGGAATGGHATTSYTYNNYNILNIISASDPAGLV